MGPRTAWMTSDGRGTLNRAQMIREEAPGYIQGFTPIFPAAYDVQYLTIKNKEGSVRYMYMYGIVLYKS